LYFSFYSAEAWNDLEDPIKNKRKFYSVLIGGKPGATSGKWDAFENELILKPLEQKNYSEEGEGKSPTKAQQGPFVMVTRFGDIEGTEVLSE
jgi:hypothetical protein